MKELHINDFISSAGLDNLISPDIRLAEKFVKEYSLQEIERFEKKKNTEGIQIEKYFIESTAKIRFSFRPMSKFFSSQDELLKII
jgi:hypothetical protein